MAKRTNNKTGKIFWKLVVFTLCTLVISIPICFATELNLTYDANGNLITGDSYYREYNGFNQLEILREGNDDSGTILERYIYHPTEERILIKMVKDITPEAEDETVVYVNENFVRSYNLKGIREVNDTYYIKDEDGIAAEILCNGTTTSPVFGQVKKLFYHNDHLGSTSVITNESGELVEETFYEPFGAILDGGVLARFDYEGKEYSDNTGDYDFHFRKYDPELLMFTQPDSLIQNVYDPQLLNRYAFERNNPWKNTDEDGHITGLEVARLLLFLNTIILGKGIFDVIHESSEDNEEEALKKQEELVQGQALQIITVGINPIASSVISTFGPSIMNYIRDSNSNFVYQSSYYNSYIDIYTGTCSMYDVVGTFNPVLKEEIDASSNSNGASGTGGSSIFNTTPYSDGGDDDSEDDEGDDYCSTHSSIWC